MPLSRHTRALLALAVLATYAGLLLAWRLVPWHDAILFPAAVYACTRLAGPRPRLAILALLSTAFLALTLFYIWSAGFGGRNHLFAGVFPLSDAGEYYWDAERVLHGARMSSGGARRPLFSTVLAGVLRVTGNSQRVAHVVTLLFWTSAGSFAAREVWRTHGRNVGAIVFVIFVCFARRYVGFVQSEGLGAPLGALAFGLVWRAESTPVADTRTWRPLFFGALMLQTVAILARPGPMFIVVGLGTWGVLREVRLGVRTRANTLRCIAESIAVVLLAIALHDLVRRATIQGQAYGDLPPILYGLLHGEDSNYLWSKNPWLMEVAAEKRGMAVWNLLASEAASHPGQTMLAPFRCLASWVALPQGFFGFLWSNPDDRVLEDASAVRAAMAAHGLTGPLRLWIRELGIYSLGNAAVMALAAATFVLALLRSTWRARRQRPIMLWPLLLAIAIALPLLPPWITEGAQILATCFFYVVAFAVTGCLPPRGDAENDGDNSANAPELDGRLIAPIVIAAIFALATVALVWPSRARAPGCGDGGAYLAEVDPSAVIRYGGANSTMTERDMNENLRALRKNNPVFAAALTETLNHAHRIFPAYDTCHERARYVTDAFLEPPLERWMWLTTEPACGAARCDDALLEKTLAAPRAFAK